MAQRRGFSLIEVLAGLTVASVASIGLISGLQLTRIDTAARLPMAAGELQAAVQSVRRHAITVGTDSRLQWQTQNGCMSYWLETQTGSSWLALTNPILLDAAIDVTPQSGFITLSDSGNATANQTLTLTRYGVTLRVEISAAGGIVHVLP